MRTTSSVNKVSPSATHTSLMMQARCEERSGGYNSEVIGDRGKLVRQIKIGTFDRVKVPCWVRSSQPPISHVEPLLTTVKVKCTQRTI